MIVSITAPRAQKIALDTASPTVVIRFKIQGHSQAFQTVAMNPFFKEPQEGEGFLLSKSLKSVGKAVKSAGPIGEAMVVIGAATGQPEIAALGATTVAASKLAGGGQKKSPSSNAPNGRYKIMTNS